MGQDGKGAAEVLQEGRRDIPGADNEQVMVDAEKRSMWIVVLPWAAFPMVGEPCTKEDALKHARGIWHHAEIN